MESAGQLFALLALAAAANAGAPAGYGADPQQSRLEFTGVQAGADFKGTFHKWSAAVDFAPDQRSAYVRAESCTEL